MQKRTTNWLSLSDVAVMLGVHPSTVRAWADQGVLLLNATLTVRAHQAGSHQNKGWEKFTDAVIQQISEQKENIVLLNNHIMGNLVITSSYCIKVNA